MHGLDDETLAAAIGLLLRQTGRTLATAESCTGGWLARMIVDVPGSSDYYKGGWVTYSDELKTTCLGVTPKLIADHGAVSEPVVRAMACGALGQSGADEAVAVTGIAGPTGGSADKPVGTVFIGVASRNGDGSSSTVVRRFHFNGDRSEVRDCAAREALRMLRVVMGGGV